MKLGFNLEKYSFALVPGLIIVAAVISLIVLLPGQIQYLSDQNSQLAAEKSKINELRTKHLLLSSLDEAELEQRAKISVAALPEDKNIPIILQSLREAVNDPGFLIEELSFSPGVIEKSDEENLEVKRIEELPLKVKVIGRTEDLLDLLLSFERRLPLFEIKDCKIASLGREGDRLRMELSLLTFYRPPIKVEEVDSLTTEELILDKEELALFDKLNDFILTEIEPIVIPEGELDAPKEDPFL